MSSTGGDIGRGRTRSSRGRLTLPRRSFVAGLVALSGCNGLNINTVDVPSDDDGTPSPGDEPSGSAATGSYLTVVESSFVRGRTFDDEADERGGLELRVRNDAGQRMRAVDLMPSFYDADGKPVHVGTRTVWNLDADETWRVTVPYPGRGEEVGAYQVAGAFTLGSAVTGTADSSGDASGNPLELVSGSDGLAVDACDATVSGRVRNAGPDAVRYAGVLVRLYADGELLGTAVSHRVGLDAASEWEFAASIALDDLAAEPTDYAVEVSAPWWVRGY